MSSATHQHGTDAAALLRSARAQNAELATPHAALRTRYSLPWVEELTPAPMPEELFGRLMDLPHVLFLDSALRHPTLGRYSFLTADPFEWLQARGSLTSASGEAVLSNAADPFAVLEERLGRYRAEQLPGLPPFQGGAAGLFSYDLCHHLERLPRPRFDEFEVPDLAVGFYDWVVAFDHSAGRAWLISTGFPETDPVRRRQRARQRASEATEQLRAMPTIRGEIALQRRMELARQWPVA